MTRTIRMKDITGLKANAQTAPFVTTEPTKIGGVRGGGSTPPSVDPGDLPPVSSTLPAGYSEVNMVAPINTGSNSIFSGWPNLPDPGDVIAYNKEEVYVGGSSYHSGAQTTLTIYESGLITAPQPGTYVLYVKDVSDAEPVYEPFFVTLN